MRGGAILWSLSLLCTGLVGWCLLGPLPLHVDATLLPAASGDDARHATLLLPRAVGLNLAPGQPLVVHLSAGAASVVRVAAPDTPDADARARSSAVESDTHAVSLRESVRPISVEVTDSAARRASRAPSAGRVLVDLDYHLLSVHLPKALFAAPRGR